MTEQTPLHGTDLEPKPTVLANVRYLGQQGDRVYAYIVPDFLAVERGDLVVVQVRDTVALARVINLNGSPEYATKYVVQRVELERFDEWLKNATPF